VKYSGGRAGNELDEIRSESIMILDIINSTEIKDLGHSLLLNQSLSVNTRFLATIRSIKKQSIFFFFLIYKDIAAARCF
jgi:hypothetical protein